jgi:hypothetical protein
MKKKQSRRLHKLTTEAFALLEYLVQDCVFSGQAKATRLRIPYKSVVPGSTADGEIVIELSLYFDNVMEYSDDKSTKVFSITGPHKNRH